MNKPLTHSDVAKGSYHIGKKIIENPVAKTVIRSLFVTVAHVVTTAYTGNLHTGHAASEITSQALKHSKTAENAAAFVTGSAVTFVASVVAIPVMAGYMLGRAAGIFKSPDPN
jgi:hypothetical protein